MKKAFAVITLILAASSFAIGQRKRAPEKSSPPQKETPAPAGQEVDENDVVRVRTSLVSVLVTVTDRKGKFVLSLRQGDFHIYEDGVEQEVAYFSPAEVSTETKPFTIALLLDVSDSTQLQLPDIQNAAITFVNQLRPDDRVMVVSFDQRVEMLAEATNDRSVLVDAIRRAKMNKGGTSLYNAVDMIINQRLNSISGPKAIVLFSDGVDTTSRGATSVTNVRAAEAVGVLVYPVQYNTLEDVKRQMRSGIREQYPGGPLIFSTPVSSEKSRRRAFDEATIYLRTLARSTGGRFYYADGIGDLAQAFTRIAEELRQQYILGYYPKSQPEPGERRQIKVSVNQSALNVRARKSYVFVPTEKP